MWVGIKSCSHQVFEGKESNCQNAMSIWDTNQCHLGAR